MKFVRTWVSKMKQLLAILVPIRHDDPSQGGRDVSVPESLVGRLPTVQSWESEDVITWENQGLSVLLATNVLMTWEIWKTAAE